MTKLVLCLLLLALATGQQGNNCKVCARARQCDSLLFTDTNIDPIYTSLTTQLSISTDPSAISRSQNTTHAYYTFAWPTRSYLATVDLTTRAFSVVENTPSSAAAVKAEQTALGVRSDSLVSNEQELISRIDSDIRKKYSFGQDVKCLSIERVAGGYHAVYQKSDKTVVSIDSVVQTSGGNVVISYQLCEQNINGVSQSSAQQIFTSVAQPYLVNQNSNSQLFVSVGSGASQLVSASATSTSSSASSSSSTTSASASQASPVPSSPVSAPKTGGYSVISANSQEVSAVVNFLIGKLGTIINQCSIVSVERQVVNGYNYRLTLSFDSSSSAQYVIVVYQTIAGSLSITSLTLANVQRSYSFGSALTASQTGALPYLNALVASLSSQLSSVLTAGTVIDAVFKSFPYFQLYFHNTLYQKITVIALYDVLNNNATIISQTSVPVPAPQTPQPVPPIQTSPIQTPPPIAGGYSSISNPLSDQGVLTVISFLISNLGNIVKSANLVLAERQVVSGYNYRLTLSFDSSSSAQYVVVVYQTIQGALSITSLNFVNVKTTYSFGTALTASQTASLSYLNSLTNVLSSQLGSLLTSGTVLDSVFKDFPYFQLVLHNSNYQQITLIVLYDLLRNNVTVINQTAIPTPAPVPTPVPAPTPTPAPVPAPSSQTQCNYPGYQVISNDLRQTSYISDYVSYLASTDSRYSKTSLVNIYWKVDDHSSIKYVFQFASALKEVNADCDYIQYTLARKPTSRTAKLSNCLVQSGSVCTKCAFKYFLANGICNPVQVECSDFNYDSKTCEGCYSGYYLDLGAVCRKADYLCQSSDRKGNCLTCFNNYHLSCKGKCIYTASGASDQYPEQEDNPLCAAFSKLTCLSCVRGCYMNTAGLCRIPDPNCDSFDQKKEVCTFCMEGYQLSDTSRTCVPVQRQY